MNTALPRLLFLIVFMSAGPALAHCGKDLSGVVPNGEFLLKLFKEARAMSYVSQTEVGRNPFRKSKANPEFLSEAVPLTSEEIEFIRAKEKKFRLTDEEIADYYMIKIYNQISNEKSRLLASLAAKNFEHVKLEISLSREQLQFVQSALRTINSDLNSLSESDLAKAREFLDEPLPIFSRRELQALLDAQSRFKDNKSISHQNRRAEQIQLMNSGLSANDSSSILSILEGQKIETSACCQTFVTSVPCVACGLNVSYNHLERERSNQKKPKLATSSESATIPSRLFIYQR